VTVSIGAWLFHPIFLAIIGTMIISSIPMVIIFHYWFKIQNNWMAAKDARMNIWKQAFTAVKYFKTRAFENYIYRKVNDARREEINWGFKNTLIYTAFVLILLIGPALSIFMFFKIYFHYGYQLEVSKIAIFLKLSMELTELVIGFPASFGFINELAVGLKRINRLLDYSELDIVEVKNKHPSTLDNPERYAAVIEYGSFYWRIKTENKEDGEEEEEEEDKKKKKDRNKKKKKRKDKIPQNNSIIHAPEDENANGRQAIDTPLLDTTNDNLEANLDRGKEAENKDGSNNNNLDDSDSEDEDTVKIGFQLFLPRFTVEKGKVTFLIGKIGSGKSSVLYALLGEMGIKDKQSIRINIEGKIRFIGQKPWILNGTIKENIILNLPFDSDKFEAAVKYSAMSDDIDQFQKGVETETGEGGDALSGGQRTRLALAQMLYQSPDIYVFDDILSALDAQVGSFVMQETILGYLKGKTVLMSTHAVQYLPRGDKIYLLEEGKIEAEGTFDEVSHCSIYQKYLELNKQLQESEEKKQEEVVSELVLSMKKNSSNRKDSTSASGEIEDSEKAEEVLAQLMIPEDREKGNVSWSTFLTSIRMFGNWWGLILLLIVCTVEQIINVKVNLLLANWSEHFLELDTDKTLQEYLKLSLLPALLGGSSVLLVGVFGYRLSKIIHSKMIYAVLHSRIEEFISRVPSGRIMNRFSNDLEKIDMSLMFHAQYFMFKFSTFIVGLATYGILIGWELVICILLMTIICIYLQRIYMSVRREVLRLASVAKSPALAVFSDACKGLPTIRNANLVHWTRDNFINRLDQGLKNDVVRDGLNAWYNVSTALVTNFIVIVPAYMLIVFFKKDMVVSNIMVSILMGTNLARDITELLTSYTNIESSMISVERCNHFENIVPESQYMHYAKDLEMADGSVSTTEALIRSQLTVSRPFAKQGVVRFENMSCMYSTSSGPILKKLTFEIKPKEKVGVIGRTGSGKSTLVKLLWRALDYFEGDILIDGKSIKQIDLKSLRSSVMILTQETALIEATLRENIDIRLVDKSRDAEIKALLDKLGFANNNFLSDGLDVKLDGDGSNLSAGEKQLISFARTILDKKPILVLDEATANIDLKTEEKIQQCIAEEFVDTTMIVIHIECKLSWAVTKYLFSRKEKW